MTRPSTELAGVIAIDHRRALEGLSRSQLADYAVFLASNRGPVELEVQAQGEIRLRRGPGGLVTAMRSALEELDATWIAAAMSASDEAAARLCGGDIQVQLGGRGLRLNLVTPRRDDFERYYDRISNQLLWFLFHGIAYSPHEPDFDESLWADWGTYRRVNNLFATRLLERIASDGRPPLVLVQDFHLLLMPGIVRRRAKQARILHFTHIPWPSPDALRALPGSIRTEILESLLSSDIIGFHTQRYARNFCLSCREYLGCEVDLEAGWVRHHKSVVPVRAYPISVDPDGLMACASSPEVQGHERALSRLAPAGAKIVLQVARSDPSKNILRSLKAFNLLLENVASARGKTCFWAILPASRQGAEPYRRYLEEVLSQARHIEALWRTPNWRPISIFTQENYARGIAAMKRYDVLLVNSLADGMNLVAKEGPIVNRQDGVLVLSENAGASEELATGAVLVNPYDVSGTASALEQALQMSPAERHDRIIGLRQQIREHPISRWLHDQLRDLLEAGKPASGVTAMFWREGKHGTRPQSTKFPS